MQLSVVGQFEIVSFGLAPIRAVVAGGRLNRVPFCRRLPAAIRHFPAKGLHGSGRTRPFVSEHIEGHAKARKWPEVRLSVLKRPMGDRRDVLPALLDILPALNGIRE